ncbi:MAG TPA: hypothetical protein VGI81_14965 [Tepidisphaeraceae bacterium]
MLDECYRLLTSGQVRAGMDLLMDRLSRLRRAHGSEQWDVVFLAEAIRHPISRLIWQDPFTDHSFRKPRGYPGDAALLDYIYGRTGIPEGTSELGEAIFQVNRDRQAPRSVRSRAQILARAIDEAAARFDSPRILSIACGHLREAEMSSAVMDGRVGELIALDQDPLSLAEVDRAYGAKGVRPVQQSVRNIIAGKTDYRDLHLVYAAGLYDYLSDRVAARLTELMFDMLAPGGSLLVANFAPCVEDLGYIESYMGWKLIYREPEQMTALAAGIPSSQWKSHRLFWDEHESIIFLEITKRQTIKPTVTFLADPLNVAVPGLANVTTGDRVRSRNGAHPHNGVRNNGAENPSER